MLRLAFLLPLPALFSALSWGAQNPDLPGEYACVSALQGQIKISVNVLDPNLAEYEVEQMVSVVRDLETRLRGVLPMPSHVKLDLQRVHHQYGAFAETNLIAAALLPSYSASPEPRFGRANLAHELGHLLLNQALMQRNARFTALDAGNRARLQRLFQLEKSAWSLSDQALARRNAAFATGRREEAAAWLATYYRRLNRYESLQRMSERLRAERRQAYVSILGPYDEFFGDLLAVLYSGDGRIVSESVAQSADDSASVEVIHRDFTAPLPADLREYANELRADFARDPRARQWQHTALGAARRYVWHRHLARAIHDRAATTRIVRGVLNAIFAETERAAASFRPGDPRPSEETLNYDFIAAIERELGP